MISIFSSLPPPHNCFVSRGSPRSIFAFGLGRLSFFFLLVFLATGRSTRRRLAGSSRPIGHFRPINRGETGKRNESQGRTWSSSDIPTTHPPRSPQRKNVFYSLPQLFTLKRFVTARPAALCPHTRPRNFQIRNSATLRRKINIRCPE